MARWPELEMGKNSATPCTRPKMIAFPIDMFLYAAITYIGVSEGWIATFVIACLATWVCDSFALFGGKAFGRHKVAPYVSPHKTVEGCICGALSSLPTGVISYYLLGALGVHNVPLWLCVAASLAASSFGQVGDLAASLLKRMVLVSVLAAGEMRRITALEHGESLKV